MKFYLLSRQKEKKRSFNEFFPLFLSFVKTIALLTVDCRFSWLYLAFEYRQIFAFSTVETFAKFAQDKQIEGLNTCTTQILNIEVYFEMLTEIVSKNYSAKHFITKDSSY